jgi:HAD superfamily hydrolase (TIGR01509 family)
MTPGRLRAVTFDLDGLMFNTEELYDAIMHELCSRRQLTFTDELRVKMMGRPGEIALAQMIEHHALVGDTPAALLEESDLLFTAALEIRLATMPGLLELLDALEAAGIPKAIATSSRRKYVDYVLTRFELADRFAFILSAENVSHGKPHPEVYLAAAQRHGVLPGEMMVLEDSQNGCRAAVDAEAFAVAIPGIHSRTHDFTGAAIVAESLSDPQIYTAMGLLSPRANV